MKVEARTPVEATVTLTRDEIVFINAAMTVADYLIENENVKPGPRKLVDALEILSTEMWELQQKFCCHSCGKLIDIAQGCWARRFYGEEQRFCGRECGEQCQAR